MNKNLSFYETSLETALKAFAEGYVVKCCMPNKEEYIFNHISHNNTIVLNADMISNGKWQLDPLISDSV